MVVCWVTGTSGFSVTSEIPFPCPWREPIKDALGKIYVSNMNLNISQRKWREFIFSLFKNGRLSPRRWFNSSLEVQNVISVMEDSLRTSCQLAFFGFSFSWQERSVSRFIQKLNSPHCGFFLLWEGFWDDGITPPPVSGFSGIFAVGLLGCSLLDKYLEMIFSRHMSQFSKNAFQVASSSTSGWCEPDCSPSVPQAYALDPGTVRQSSGSRATGQLGPSTEGLCTRVTRNGHKSTGF